MNRRSFLRRLGVAASGAALLTVDDPERLLWMPGAKKIIDLGATKQVLPATDAEVTRAFAQQILASPVLTRQQREVVLHDLPPYADRDIRLDIGGTSFHYKGPKLVSLHSAEELALLDKPLFPSWPSVGRSHIGGRRAGKTADFSLIDVPEDHE